MSSLVMQPISSLLRPGAVMRVMLRWMVSPRSSHSRQGRTAMAKSARITVDWQLFALNLAQEAGIELNSIQLNPRMR
jgi:hypothetical protein